MTVREYALGLLRDCGCSLDCYKGEYAKYALQDIQQVATEQELPYSIEDIAEALIQIGNEQPDPPRKGHKQFCHVFDVGHSVDGVEYDDFEEAKSWAIDTLVQWVVDEQAKWPVDEKGKPHPTEKQIEDWDQMIEDCCVYVVEWDEDAGDWGDVDDAWFPSHEDETNAEWLYWEELKQKHGW